MKQLLELIKSNWLFVILGLLVVIFAVIGIVRNMSVKDENSTKTSQTQQSSSSSKEETEDEKNYRKAKLALDHPYSEASQADKEAATPNVTIAMDFITSHNNIDDMKGSLENHLYMSQNPMIQMVIVMILLSWKSSRVIVATLYSFSWFLRRMEQTRSISLQTIIRQSIRFK